MALGRDRWRVSWDKEGQYAFLGPSWIAATSSSLTLGFGNEIDVCFHRLNFSMCRGEEMERNLLFIHFQKISLSLLWFMYYTADEKHLKRPYMLRLSPGLRVFASAGNTTHKNRYIFRLWFNSFIVFVSSKKQTNQRLG